MIQALIQRWLAGQDPSAPEARQKCGARAGMVGILLNTLLCLGKLAAGMITGSVAIVADALNNLSDAASSVITLVGFRLAGQAADEEHPFGHGRMEYLTGLVVSMAILLMGFELGKSSVEKLIHPEELDFSWLAAAILAAAVLVKLWMYRFNRAVGRAISSQAVEATAADSLSDAAATAVVLAATLIGHFFHLQIDGLAGLLVAAFILKTGCQGYPGPPPGPAHGPGAGPGHRQVGGFPPQHSGYPRPGVPRLRPRPGHDVLPRGGARRRRPVGDARHHRPHRAGAEGETPH